MCRDERRKELPAAARWRHNMRSILQKSARKNAREIWHFFFKLPACIDDCTRQKAMSEQEHIRCCIYWMGDPAGAGGTTSLVSQCVTPALKSSQRHSQRTPADLCRGAKRPESEAYYSPLPAKAKNECSYIGSRSRLLQCVHCGDCTSTPTDEAELSRNCCQVRIRYVVIKRNASDWLYFAWALQPALLKTNDDQRTGNESVFKYLIS